MMNKKILNLCIVVGISNMTRIIYISKILIVKIEGAGNTFFNSL